MAPDALRGINIGLVVRWSYQGSAAVYVACRAQHQWDRAVMATVTIQARRHGRHVTTSVAGCAGLAGVDEVRECAVVAAGARGGAIDYPKLVGARGGRALLGSVDKRNRDCRGERANKRDDE